MIKLLLDFTHERTWVVCIYGPTVHCPEKARNWTFATLAKCRKFTTCRLYSNFLNYAKVSYVQIKLYFIGRKCSYTFLFEYTQSYVHKGIRTYIAIYINAVCHKIHHVINFSKNVKRKTQELFLKLFHAT